jgi:hypothetical protein
VIQLTGGGCWVGHDPGHADDHADHDGADHRCARIGPALLARGAIALGLNPLRATLAVSLRAIRPAIVAATALATARAIGEAVVVSMVSGGKAFAPNPLDGKIFFFEPVETLASEIVRQARTSARRRCTRRSTRSRCCCCSRASCCRSRAT